MTRRKRVARQSRTPIVVDTNVLIAANALDPAWKPIAALCANRLQSIMNSNVVCSDSLGLILAEYGSNLPSRSRAGFGDMFFLWLARNRFNTRCSHTVEITPHEASGFHEFPKLADELAASIDPSDRKFIAVANAHPEKPPILEATDSKWIGWKDGLAEAGITIEFVDEEFLRPFYERKMGQSGK
jgi:hypothetical protein